MPGVIVSINGRQIAAVSTSDLNILTVNIGGDVLGEELSAIEMQGGLYGQGENDKHLIWVHDFHINENDVVEIKFAENVQNSHAGKTIEELYPSDGRASNKEESLESIYEDLSGQTKVRSGFRLKLHSSNKQVESSTLPDDYSFNCSAMWRWVYPEELKISLSSNTLERIRNRESGAKHCDLELKYEESATLKISGI